MLSLVEEKCLMTSVSNISQTYIKTLTKAETFLIERQRDSALPKHTLIQNLNVMVKDMPGGLMEKFFNFVLY